MGCPQWPLTSVLPAWFSKMCHESLTYFWRRDQFESINTLNKQASTLARPSCCLTATIQLQISVWLHLLTPYGDLWRPLPARLLPPLPFCIAFNSPSASTQTITSKWKHCSTPAVVQKQRQSPPHFSLRHCLVLCVPLLLNPSSHPSIHFFLQPAGILGLCQINWGHPLIQIQPTVSPVNLPPPNCTLEKKKPQNFQTSNFPGVLVQRQRIYPETLPHFK